MYIEPNSTIKILKNVPLDNTYKHSLYFASISTQNTYFAGKAKYTLTKQSYQRVVKGKMRVQLCADDIYDCNYMMFNNTTFGQKWFYAFITGIEYVNNVTSEITFEIDSLQTYFFDTELLACYVEREHSATDAIGDNLVPENVGNPELCVMNVWTRYWDDDDWKCAIQVSPSIIGQAVGAGDPINIGNNQLYPATFEIDMSAIDLTNLNTFLRAVDLVGALIGGYYFPREFGDTIAPIQINDLNTHGIARPTSYIKYDSTTVLPSEYTPKNKKLFTSPYTNLMVCSTSGGSATYKWEDTRDGYVMFNLHHNHLNNAACELRPTNYYRNPQSRLNTVEIEEFPKVTLSDNPNLTFGNLYNALSALNESAMNGADTSGQGTGGELPVSLLPIMFANSPSGKVSVTNGNLDLKYNTFGFVFYQMGIRAQDAEVIDNYFSMFGYATKKIKVPNRNVRPHWCYTKTRDCVVKANAPADDVRKICQIYDNGITFWKNPSEVGNYSLDNSVQ